jgi:hypothetical protein
MFLATSPTHCAFDSVTAAEQELESEDELHPVLWAAKGPAQLYSEELQADFKEELLNPEMA